MLFNHISDVMVSVLDSSAVDCGFKPCRVKAKAMKLVFIASPLRMQHYRERSKTGLVGIRIMCRSGATCLFVDCCFSELHYKNPTKCVGLVQSGHHYLIKRTIEILPEGVGDFPVLHFCRCQILYISSHVAYSCHDTAEISLIWQKNH